MLDTMIAGWMSLPLLIMFTCSPAVTLNLKNSPNVSAGDAIQTFLRKKYSMELWSRSVSAKLRPKE